jgi:hypothetical protein
LSRAIDYTGGVDVMKKIKPKSKRELAADEEAKTHMMFGPYKGCRCIGCWTHKHGMTAAQIKRLAKRPGK